MKTLSKHKLTVAMISILFAGAAIAEPLFPTEVIDFESDTTGAKANGWMSVDSTNVAFDDSVGTDMQVADWGQQSDGQGLAVFFDTDDSQLDMSFMYRLRSISLDFGNDDPNFSEEGDSAILDVAIGGSPLGGSSVVMNRDDVMNQSIGISNVGCFDTASFKYDVDPTVGLIEIVDNINMEFCGGAILDAGGKTVCTGGNDSEGGGDGNGQFSAINECDGPAGFWSPDGFTSYDGFVSAQVVLLEDTFVDIPVTPGAAWEYSGTPTDGSYFQYKQKEPNMTLKCEGTTQPGATAVITDLGAVLSGWLYTCYRPDDSIAAQFTVAPQTWVSGTGAGHGRDKDRGSAGDVGGTFVFKRGMVKTYEPE